MSMFSKGNSRLQVGWDSTSLQAMDFCPRFYQYTILENWATDSVDLVFGKIMATALEIYQKGRLAGLGRDEALMPALKRALADLWQTDLDRWETMWKCEGTLPYRNSKGNKALCPYSHKKAWFPGPAPDVCGECDSPIKEQKMFITKDRAKNRYGLIRALVWYVDEQPEELDEGLRPYQFPDGTDAVELSFKMPLPWKSPHGETYILAGHLDYIGVYGGEYFTVDNKTTKKTLSTKFWESYSPSTQFDTYDLAGWMLYPDLGLSGVLLDGIQVTVNGAAYGKHVYRKSDAHREEHLQSIRDTIEDAEKYAAQGRWPMRKRNCWTCPFKSVCSKHPAKRDHYLRANFTKRDEPWNPMDER